MLLMDGLDAPDDSTEVGNGMDARAARCADCGDPVPIGAWPFCKSDRNPEGHARGSYQWSVGNPGMRRWTHTGSKSPR
jgi:hypothetical protein